MTDDEHSKETTGLGVIERLERIEDRLQNVEIDVQEAKAVALSARQVASIAQERALAAFGRADTDPAIFPVDPPAAREEDASDEAQTVSFSEPVTDGGPDGVWVERNTFDNAVAALQGMRDSLDLLVGALTRQQD